MVQKAKMRLALAGGVSLGAYQAGACACLHQAGVTQFDWIAGSSMGAVNGAIIAGNPPDRRIEQLTRFWQMASSVVPPPLSSKGPLRRAYNWFSALQTRASGRLPLFRVGPPTLSEGFGLYDLSPLADRLTEYVDFDRLNGGEVRLSVVTTDLESGEPVIFDTVENGPVRHEHILASCGLLPDFKPVEIGGRLLGDGALVANAPVEMVTSDRMNEDVICFVIDLFSRDADRPASLDEAAGRRRDLILANQTHRALEAAAREHRLRHRLAGLREVLPAGLRENPTVASILAAGSSGRLDLVHLSYRPALEEAGPEKQFDFSPAALTDRWEAGEADARLALNVLNRDRPRDRENGVRLHRIRQ